MYQYTIGPIAYLLYFFHLLHIMMIVYFAYAMPISFFNYEYTQSTMPTYVPPFITYIF